MTGHPTKKKEVATDEGVRFEVLLTKEDAEEVKFGDVELVGDGK